MGNEIKVQNQVGMNVTAGGELIRHEGTTYGTGTLGIGGSIPIGKRFSIDPKLTGQLGKDVKGIDFQLGTSTQVSPKLSINAGVGLRQTSFSGDIYHDEMDYADGQFTGMEGEEALMQIGDFSEGGTIIQTFDSKRNQKEVYISAGATYDVTPRLSVFAGGELGNKSISKGKYTETKKFKGELCIQGAEHVYTPLEEFGDDFGIWGWKGQPVLEKYSGEASHSENFSKKRVVGGITAGAEYSVNQNLAVGLNGKVGIGNGADSNIGLNLKVKF